MTRPWSLPVADDKFDAERGMWASPAERHALLQSAVSMFQPLVRQADQNRIMVWEDELEQIEQDARAPFADAACPLSDGSGRLLHDSCSFCEGEQSTDDEADEEGEVQSIDDETDEEGEVQSTDDETGEVDKSWWKEDRSRSRNRCQKHAFRSNKRGPHNRTRIVPLRKLNRADKKEARLLCSGSSASRAKFRRAKLPSKPSYSQRGGRCKAEEGTAEEIGNWLLDSCERRSAAARWWF